MKTIVVGNGKIGGLLMRQLLQKGYEAAVVDNSPARPESMQGRLDVAAVPDNGASIEILRETGVDSADLLTAVTNNDGMNLLTALVAEKLGCNYTVTRVRSPEYDREMNLLKTNFGTNVSIDPEKTCVEETFCLLQSPTFLTRNSFTGDRVEMVEFIVPGEGKLTGRKLLELTNVLDKKALIRTTGRNGEVLVPSSSTEFHAGDKLGLAAATADLPVLLHRFGIRMLDVKNMMIIGGSAIIRYLATDLLYSGLHVMILGMDFKKCEALEDLLPGATIIHGDGSLQYVSAEEDIANTDAVVPLTGIDEESIMVSLYAHSIDTKKTITKVNRTKYVNLSGQEYLGAVVNPKALTANEITRYARAASQTRGGSVETLHTPGGGFIEPFGFTMPEDAPFVNKPIMELLPQLSILIASTARNQRVIIPDGQDCLVCGDSIVVTARASQMVSSLTDISRNCGGGA